MENMTDFEKVELYNSLFRNINTIPKLEPIKNELNGFVSYYNDFILRTKTYILDGKLSVEDSDKISFITRLLEVVNKIIDNNLINDFRKLYFYIIDNQINGNYIPDALNLICFPDDCFKLDGIDKNDYKKIYERYLFIIEQILICEGYDYYETNHRLPELANAYFNYEWHNRSEQYNPFIPSIILFSLKNNYDNGKFLEMMIFSYDHLMDLCNYIELNDDKNHDIELYFKVIDKIDGGSTNKQIIR